MPERLFLFNPAGVFFSHFSKKSREGKILVELN